MPTRDALELFAPFFESLTDPRMERTRRHSLLDIIILAVCATLGNADGWADIERFGKAKLDFFRTFLELPNGIPSHDTFGRVFARLDPAPLMACIQQWLDALATAVAGEVVDIKNSIVTIDAMGCQKEIAAKIRAREADYVLAVKDNRPRLHQAVHEAFVAHAEEDFTDPTLKRIKTVERSHGRDETREYFVAEAPAALVREKEWSDVRSIGMVSRTRVIN